MDADVIIIGAGMGGATLALALAPTGLRVLIVERGARLVHSPQARDPAAIFGRGHFRPDEEWLDGHGRPFNPGNYYHPGGNTKFYGAALIRYRAQDFTPVRHAGGMTTGWPIPYDALEPFYQQAEEIYQVRGDGAADPTEPPHSGHYPHPPVPHEPAVADLAARLSRQGLHPAPIPLGLDLELWLKGGATTWDGFPNTQGGKMDAETVALAQALERSNVTLRTGARVTRLISRGRRVTGIEVADGSRLSAPRIVLAAGAVNTAALLLASGSEDHPRGLANRSDQVGRNFMNHNCSAVLALHPLRRNRSIYQKTLMLNDFYLNDPGGGAPLGNVQMLGKITGPILAGVSGLPGPLAAWIAARSLDLYAMSEDLPDPDSRVTLRGGRIMLDWRRSNWAAHERLVRRLKSVLRRAGYPVVLSRPFDRRTPSHQCGTARMGADPARSVTDPFGRCHDLDNLFITDASVLPTSAAVNPALTIAALSLRAAPVIAGAA
ncbi:MAG: GMC family oxidoreductase [Paracoccus sp. (in: a-proteobacteria)]|nr:GMC family oxidoreductase [Paracoccus sp. (in: a-proteobacteria)]